MRLAERMGEDIVTFERQVTGHDLRPSGELRVTTNDTVLVHLMTGVFAAFRKAYPEIVLDVVVSNQALNLSKRDADVAVRATDRPPDALIGRRAASIAWAVFGASEKAPESVRPESDARDADWVGFGDNLANLKAAKWLKDHAAPGRVVYRINTVLGLAEAAAAGIGLRAAPLLHRLGDAGADPPHRPARPTSPTASGCSPMRTCARPRACAPSWISPASEIAKQRKTIEGLS